MPLNYGLITKKPELEYKFSDGTTETVKDLLAKTFDNTVDFSNAYTIVEVTKEYIARPDLVSFVLYHTDEYADILCKINGISNPFELMEGNILICPREEFINRFSKAVSDNMDGLASTSSSLLTRKQSFKKNKGEKRSPNEATVFDHNYVQVGDTNLLIY